MTPAEVTSAISTLGFPIVVAMFLAYLIWDLAKYFKAKGDQLADRFVTHIDATDKQVAEIKPALQRIDETTGRTFEIITRPASSGS